MEYNFVTLNCHHQQLWAQYSKVHIRVLHWRSGAQRKREARATSGCSVPRQGRSLEEFTIDYYYRRRRMQHTVEA